jgi:hypothetical protein
MDNPETMSMLDTQDTGRTQKNIWFQCCYANIDIGCLYLSLYHYNALVYENKES